MEIAPAPADLRAGVCVCEAGMGILTKKGRAEIPAGKFAGPNRSFPIENRGHAEAAVIDASRDRKLKPSVRASIERAAKKVLAK